MSDIEQALSQIVPIGTTPQQIELGEAVKRHVSNKPPIRPAATNGNNASQLANVDLVRALFDARNAIDAALAQLKAPQ
jgi:hypothetical protein